VAVIEGGTSAVVQEVGAAAAKGAHVIVKPTDHGSLGHYSFGGFTGILPAALGANSEIFQFRWVDATRFAVIRKIRIAASVTTTFFAAGVPVQIDLVKAITWTVAGTGGTGITPAALLKLRTTGMGSTLVAAGDVRIATTAALGAGTKTLETLPLSSILAGGPITASLKGTIIEPGTILWQAEIGDAEHPLILAQNEGFVIRSVAVPATGTWMAAVNVSWAEVTAF
jgi:hypothetical protein